MSLLGMGRTELKEFFEENLDGLVKEDDVRHHLAGALDGFVYERGLPLGEELPATVISYDHFSDKAFSSLIWRGDAYLFMCGWFPEYVHRQTKANLGPTFYIQKGKECYNFALSLIHQKEAIGRPTTLYKLSREFRTHANALYAARERMRLVVEELKPVIDVVTQKTREDGMLTEMIALRKADEHAQVLENRLERKRQKVLERMKRIGMRVVK